MGQVNLISKTEKKPEEQKQFKLVNRQGETVLEGTEFNEFYGRATDYCNASKLCKVSNLTFLIFNKKTKSWEKI